MKFFSKSELNRATCLQTAALIAALALPGTAFAQDTATNNTTSTTTATECADTNNNGVCDSEESAGIVVTGSRIQRSTFNSPSPIEVFTRDDATVAGFDSSTAVLQSTAVTAGARQIDNTFGGFLVDGGAGANTLSLRSLGAARTLILLNGRRLAPSGTSGSLLSSDLNVLPSAIVQRIEVLKDGASSIYGSDAIAGVVNVITDKKVSGLTLDAGVSVPEVGEGIVRRVALIAGYNTDRLNISGSVEVFDRNNLSYGSHEYLRCQTEYTRNTPADAFGTGGFIDPRTGKPKCYPTGFTGADGVTVNTIGTSTRAGAAAGPGAVPGALFNRFRVNPSAGGSVPGFEGVNGGSFNGNRDTTNSKFFDKSLISPTTNYTGYLQGTYDLHALGDAQIYADGLYARRESAQRSFFQLIIDYPTGSPLIPSVLAFSDQPAMDQLGTRRVGVRVFTSRNYTPSQRVQYTRFGGGLRGSLPFSDWKYDLYAGHSYNNGEYTLRQPITSRLAQSQTIVSNGSGGFNCVDTSNGCVAAPAITAAVINGDVPQAYLDFIAPAVTGTTKFWETTFAANLNGSLFALPAGNVGVALGAEYRKQRIDDEPPIEQQVGQLYNYSTAGVTKGKDAVREVFGELEIPLVKDTLFHELSLNGSARYTDYDSYGSGWTYKVGGVFSPIRALTFRGTYGTSFRAPGLSEQFKAATAGFLSATVDPCNNYGALAPTTTIYKNCLAAGIPTTYGNGAAGSPLGQSVQVNTTGGSQTGLAAETSKSWTVGAIIQPPLGSVGKLELAIDYFNIEVNNGVGLFGGGNIISSCYNDPQFSAGTNGGELCQFITRQSATGARPYGATVTNGYLNLAKDKVRGMDFDLRFTSDVGPGSLRINAGATRYFEQSNQLTPKDTLDDNNGQIYYPKWTGNLDMTYKVGEVSLFYGLNWVGVMDSYEALQEDPATSIYQFRTPNYFTHNASISWNIENFRTTLGVKNFTDKEPPQISAFVYNRLGNSPLYSGFDFVGRTFFMNVTAKIK